MIYILQGFLLGVAYVAPIGTQNLYVIHSALKLPRMKAFTLSFIIFLFDISLALLCFYGVGLLILQSHFIKMVILLIGSILVIYIGVSLINRAPNNMDKETHYSISKVLTASFSVTFLNPQAIIDGSMLLGNYRATLSIENAHFFMIGVCLASFVWFMSLTFIISIFHTKINPKVVKIMNLICGTIIIIFGIRLGYIFYTLINEFTKY